MSPPERGVVPEVRTTPTAVSKPGAEDYRHLYTLHPGGMLRKGIEMALAYLGPGFPTLVVPVAPLARLGIATP
jgi:hypothetical protein